MSTPASVQRRAERADQANWHDTGCPDKLPESQPSCLRCPLLKCRFETHDLDFYVKRRR